MLLDGHSSHYSFPLLLFAKAHNIEILGYPPHTTHMLQGLDVVCFAKMKSIWKEGVTKHKQNTGEKLSKSDFLEVWGEAYLKALNAETVKAVFWATGIHPYNLDVITTKQMKPSCAFLTNDGRLLEPSSLVKAVLVAFSRYKPMALELNDDTHHPTHVHDNDHNSDNLSESATANPF